MNPHAASVAMGRLIARAAEPAEPHKRGDSGMSTPQVAWYALRLADDLRDPNTRIDLWGVLRVTHVPGGNGPRPLRNYVPAHREVTLLVDDEVHKRWGRRSEVLKWSLSGWIVWLREEVLQRQAAPAADIVLALAKASAGSTLSVWPDPIPEAEAEPCQRVMWTRDIPAEPSGSPEPTP